MSTGTTGSGTSAKVWLITGASSGLGRAIAEAALAAGDTVVAAARKPAAVADLVAAHEGRATAVELDVTDLDRCAAVVAEVVAAFGRVDVLVNNAGRGIFGAVEEITDRELRELMELHYFGPAALVRAVLPHMRRRRSGAIVQMSSMGGRCCFPGSGAYSGSKFALEGLSEALALEVGPLGIKVLIVEPGAFRTEFNRDDKVRLAASLPAYEPMVGPVRAMVPRMHGTQQGDPARAAAAVLRALDADVTPLRLPLGDDAVDAINASMDATRAEFATWEAVARNTAYDEKPGD